MRLKNKKTILHHLIPLFLLFFLAIPVYAQHGLTKTADASTLSTYNQDVPTMLGTVIGAAMSLVGVVFFVLSIYAGFLWMTARGDETQAKKARDTLTMSVIGLIIVFGAYAITAFVTKQESTNIPYICNVGSEDKCTGRSVGFLCDESSSKTCTMRNPNAQPENNDRILCDCS